jgi:hypothetical protein
MVHFPGFARARLWIHRAVHGFYPCGFPHSEIPGSMPACGSPRLIAACHVLHRLLLPRHPPCALSSLTTKFTQHIRRCSPGAFTPGSDRRVRRANLMTLAVCSSRPNVCARTTPADFKALIKLLSLVDNPIYSVVKHRPRGLTPASAAWAARALLPEVRRQTRWRPTSNSHNCLQLTETHPSSRSLVWWS